MRAGSVGAAEISGPMRNAFVRLSIVAALMTIASTAAAQDQMPMDMDMGAGGGWRFMQDGVVFGVFDHQGSDRGGNGFVVPNWWMGMATRKAGSSQLTFDAMFSLDPASV